MQSGETADGCDINCRADTRRARCYGSRLLRDKAGKTAELKPDREAAQSAASLVTLPIGLP
jgi:hypothetical protein